MERWQDRVAVVTGASSGIGAAVAKDLVRAGVIVVGMARRVELIEALKEQLPEELHSRLHAVKCDVSEEASVAAAFDWVEEQLGGIDILVNNAGLLYPGQLLTMQLEKLHHVLQVNLLGVVYCSRRAFRSMQERGVAGHVVLINSLTGHHVIHPPGETLQQLNMYPLSKHGISALLEVMRQELNGLKTQIKVTVSTAAAAVPLSLSLSASANLAPLLQSISPGVTDTQILPGGYNSLPMLQTEDISAGIMYALGTPPHVQVHQLTIKPIGEPF